MPEKDIDDAFKDFEMKVEDKKQKRPSEPELSESDEAQIRQKFEEEKQALKEKYREELAAIKVKKVEQAIKEGKLSPDQFKIERIIYISIILALLLYVGFTLVGNQGQVLKNEGIEQGSIDTLGSSQNQSNTTDSTKAKTQTENKTGIKTETKTETKPPTTKKPASGKVAFAINNVEIEKVNNDLGYIKTVSFSIQNDRDAVLTPVVNVYIYDELIEEDWLARSRGSYTYPAGIAPGKFIDGMITVVPKTFRNLNVDKIVRLELNDTKDGFLKLDTREVTIE